MKTLRSQDKRHRDESGQTLLMFVLFLVVLILFVGLGIDLGFAYITRSNLSKAVDSACLMGVRNISQIPFPTKAEDIARSTFAANYGTPGRDAGPPDVSVVFSTDAANNRFVNVDATATINTFFIRLLPPWKTLSVSAHGQATRAKVIMGLVLDRSGSMHDNGGCEALPPAVKTFIDFFDDANDRVAMSTFASDAKLVVPVSRPFKSLIKAKVPQPCSAYDGRTFGDGGLTLARDAVNGESVAPGENVVRVLVYFTDGYANTFQDSFACGQPQPLNFGASDFPVDGNRDGSFMNPSNGVDFCGIDNLDDGAPSCCPVATFKSIDGSDKDVKWSTVWNEGQLRALFHANEARANGTIIYSIGLGNNINRDFLKIIANDPTGSTHNSAQRRGEAVFAPEASDLESVFQTIANKILLRLSK